MDGRIYYKTQNSEQSEESIEYNTSRCEVTPAAQGILASVGTCTPKSWPTHIHIKFLKGFKRIKISAGKWKFS